MINKWYIVSLIVFLNITLGRKTELMIRSVGCLCIFSLFHVEFYYYFMGVKCLSYCE